MLRKHVKPPVILMIVNDRNITERIIYLEQ